MASILHGSARTTPRVRVELQKAHVLAFVKTYNFAKHLKALRWRTPFEPSHMHGPTTRRSSRSIRATSSRDQTPSIKLVSISRTEMAVSPKTGAGLFA